MKNQERSSIVGVDRNNNQGLLKYKVSPEAFSRSCILRDEAMNAEAFDIVKQMLRECIDVLESKEVEAILTYAAMNGIHYAGPKVNTDVMRVFLGYLREDQREKSLNSDHEKDRESARTEIDKHFKDEFHPAPA